MNANALPKDTYVEIKNGVDESSEGERTPTWIATIKTLKGVCDYKHNHWNLRVLKHSNISELMRLIEEELNG